MLLIKCIANMVQNIWTIFYLSSSKCVENASGMKCIFLSSANGWISALIIDLYAFFKSPLIETVGVPFKKARSIELRVQSNLSFDRIARSSLFEEQRKH